MYVGQSDSRTLGRAIHMVGGSVIVLACVLMLAACSSTATGSSSTTLATATAGSSSTLATPTAEASSTPSPATPTAAAATAVPPPQLRSTMLFHTFANVAAHSNTSIVDITCPSGYLVAGGGVTTGYPALLDQTDAPVSTTHWGVQFYNPSSSPINSQTQFTCFNLT